MLIRNGKIQFLFWTAFFSVIFLVWIMVTGFVTFILPEHPPSPMPQHIVKLMFVLYGLLAVLLWAGTMTAIMIDNTFYRKVFGGLVMLAFLNIMVAKSLFG
jgi:hypothetical protein